ncbi:hypothetical protein [Sinorhizobium fredii]|uniref:Uncharacterized protein n=2 Tax=Rhizobium fredii TaxID=380 RepID=I3XG00_SINF2|nr:hypothetical protein [Sinorhizobium fredii]AFL54806.1 hypothetical protein USDA257_p00880 [Sinorhizobium fredii USDA 257]KSV90105.1 hypothetical protein N181_12600 [Sinorhizobium fredii USDA 205]MQX08018.1 hypothetical protein [Sinorhizobium fredii]CCE99091.1 hypothetical protein SFHH103_04618 [Sinorhizobium fredii HH103]CEO91776.1 hypothetical protein SFHH103_psfHH103d_569 [Sinorhizobium fredii HH103]
MYDVSSTAAVIELRALLAVDAQIDLYSGKQLVLRATSRIANRQRAVLYVDYLEAVLLRFAIAANRTDFEVSRKIGNTLLDAIEASPRLS